MSLEDKLETLEKKIDILLSNKFFVVGEFIPAADMARMLGLERTYFHGHKSNELFEIKKHWGNLYVKPCKQIADLLNDGYICVAVDTDSDISEFEHTIKVNKKILGFWR